eukprot:1736124-Prymnesium_polylepis.1
MRAKAKGRVDYNNGTDLGAAAAVAAAADVAIVVVGSTSSEGTDRRSTALPAEQLRYLRAVAAVQSRTVVVIMAPGAVEVGPWEPLVPAVACFFMPGQAQGKAVASI